MRNPHPNQIWKELDNRFDRYVLTGKFLKDDKIELRTCDAKGNIIEGKPKTKAHVTRFKGKYGGYKFIKDLN